MRAGDCSRKHSKADGRKLVRTKTPGIYLRGGEDAVAASGTHPATYRIAHVTDGDTAR